MEVAPFFVDFHYFLSIFTIYTLLLRFTFCRDLRTFSANFFGQNSLLRNITRFLHVWLEVILLMMQRWAQESWRAGGRMDVNAQICYKWLPNSTSFSPWGWVRGVIWIVLPTLAISLSTVWLLLVVCQGSLGQQLSDKTRCQIWCTIELQRDPISKVLSEW